MSTQKQNKIHNAETTHSALTAPVLLTSREAAKKLGISLPTLRKIREHGTFHGRKAPPFIMVGAGEREGIRYVEEELNRWVLSLPRFFSTSHSEDPADKSES